MIPPDVLAITTLDRVATAAVAVVTRTPRGTSSENAEVPAVVVIDFTLVPAVKVNAPAVVGVCEAAMLFATAVLLKVLPCKTQRESFGSLFF